MPDILKIKPQYYRIILEIVVLDSKNDTVLIVESMFDQLFYLSNQLNIFHKSKSKHNNSSLFSVEMTTYLNDSSHWILSEFNDPP